MCWEVAQRPKTRRKDGVRCVPPKVMLGAGRKDDMSFSRELDSRYDYPGVSCCPTEDNIHVGVPILGRVLAKS